MSEVCSICGGSGLQGVQENGRQFARHCVCRIARRAQRMLGHAPIPRRYEHCILENYDVDLPYSDRTQAAARITAKRFIEGYPLETGGRGLLLTGSIGVGKTHLAVAILQALVAERGATGLFYDYRDLLKQVQNSYNSQVRETELEILKPVFEAEVLLLDELGAVKPTDWVWDTVAHILNTRYNDKRTTLITTNYPNQPSALLQVQSTAVTDRDVSRAAPANAATRAMREETLGDRIGERMRSRLQE